MEIKINLRDAALVVGGIAAGLLASSALINKAKKDIKKEVVSETTKTIKKEILDEIKAKDIIDEIKTEMKTDINKKLVDDILRESKDNMTNFISTVNRKVDGLESKIKDLESEIEEATESVLDIDTRIGKIISNIVRKVVKGDDEIEIEV